MRPGAQAGGLPLALALASTCAVVNLGCRDRPDDRARAAFQPGRQAAQHPTQSRRTRTRTTRTRAQLDPWQGFNELLRQAIELMAGDHDVMAFDAFARARCAVTPEARQTDQGPAFLCFPDPPLELGDVKFTLELSPVGVVGLQSGQVSDAHSRTLAQQARQATAAQCATPWRPVEPGSSPDHDNEFHICPVDGGSSLAIGRRRISDTRDRWQVSLAVLGAE